MYLDWLRLGNVKVASVVESMLEANCIINDIDLHTASPSRVLSPWSPENTIQVMLP
jgi:hypothetical protein